MNDPVNRRAAGTGRILGFEDRRSGSDRRTEPGDLAELRRRQRRRDRRESPAGHIRNALQVLAAVEHLTLVDGDRLPVDGVRRTLWLALAEIERTGRRAS